MIVKNFTVTGAAHGIHNNVNVFVLLKNGYVIPV